MFYEPDEINLTEEQQHYLYRQKANVEKESKEKSEYEKGFDDGYKYAINHFRFGID